MCPSIIFTGGGTAGHVTPNLALIDVLKEEDWEINYIGSQIGVEKEMIAQVGIPFHAISSGKLRRYFSWKNFIDPFRIIKGIAQSWLIFNRIKPDVVFSKGGFVAFPVVVAAWLKGIPILAHESDLSPGLANKLSFPFVDKIVVNFAAARDHFKNKEKVEVTGTPIRTQLFAGNKNAAFKLCGFTESKTCLLIIGGSLGSIKINQIVREALPELQKNYNIIHLCGQGKVDQSLANASSYCQFEYAHRELADLFALSDIVISRAGANALAEILALHKPHILIPLSSKVSRGDQIQNAHYFAAQGISVVLDDDLLTAHELVRAVAEVDSQRDEIQKKIRNLPMDSATSRILTLIKELISAESPKAV